MFLRAAIEKILADRDIKKKDNLQLKKACESAIEELKNEENEGKSSANGGVLPDSDNAVEADRYFLPFELACRSKSPKIVITALDCLQKLIAYGHLTGTRPDSSNPGRQLIDRIVEAICSAFAGQGTDESVLLQIIKAILAVVLSASCAVHEGSLLLAVRTCFTIYLATKSPINQATAKGTLTQVINTVFGNMEKFGDEKDDATVVREVVEGVVSAIVECTDEDMSRGGASTAGDSESAIGQAAEDSTRFPNVYQKDAWLVFRALCVLAQKEEGDLNDPRNTHLRSKLLALEMLLLVLQNSGPVLRTSQPFIRLIKTTLCVALSKNAVSPIVQVFEKSLAIFVQLVDKFKSNLKLQIEVFFKEIVLSMLESSSCSFEHKWIVLNTIAALLARPQNVVDMYVNYDCQLTSHNVFEALVQAISRTARTAVQSDAPLPQRERERAMRLLGLKCLVELLQCQAEWHDACGRAAAAAAAALGGEEEATAAPSLTQVRAGEEWSELEQLKQKKELIEHGIALFARKPKKGLQFLQEHGFVGKEAVEIAEFMSKEERLDKTVVGDFLGDPDEFNKKVMYAYVDDMDFSQKEFVAALRIFLEKFRLPGEAQKIDRLMEKFASRYCECNPGLGLFASADTAYVLAYSIIMLTTDLHSAQVRNKMTKEQYISMNRGINNGTDLPPELLTSIYDDISANEIKMKAGASKLLKSREGAGSAATAQQKKQMASLELEAMSETARVLIESLGDAASADFTSASHQQHVRPMFKICWTPCLAAFSVGLQMSDDAEEWRECIRGFRLGIRVACLLQLELERNAFIQALARFTLLNVNSKTHLAEMKEKNIDAIKLMLLTGDENGDLLEENWHDVVKCISHLEVAQMIGTGIKSAGSSRQGDSSAQYVLNSTQLDSTALSSMQEALGETSSQSVVVAVDRIFHGSSRLSGEGIVSFVRAVCDVSREELSLASPRMFMLGKLVEVAFYNMGRIRLEWSRIWQVMGELFNAAGCNASEAVAHYSVDALRQLSIKFLERGELPNFRFQKDFLRPFEMIMARNRCERTRELVVACIAHLVDAHAPRIKSGWQNVFSVWTLAASDPHTEIVEAAFAGASRVVSHQFENDFPSVLDAFQETLKCLAEFACNSQLPDMSMDAIRLIRVCAQHVAKNQQRIIDAPWEEAWSVSGEQRVWLRGWFPVFFELSCVINRCKLDVRTRSLTVMFEIMKSHGSELRPEWWRDLFKVVFRIFDHAKLDENRSDKREWLMTTCNHLLYAVVDVLTQFFDVLAEPLLPAIYEQLRVCLQQQNEQLARSTVNCLETLIVLNGEKFSQEQWADTLELVATLLRETLPKTLLTWDPDAGSSAPSNATDAPGQVVGAGADAGLSEAVLFCVVQSELVDAVSAMLLGSRRNDDAPAPSTATAAASKQNGVNGGEGVNGHVEETPAGLLHLISPPLLLRLVDALGESHRLASQFNASNGQRTLLWKTGLRGLRGASTPNLLRQETHSLKVSLAVLLRLLADSRAAAQRKEVARKVLDVVDAALVGHSSAGSEARRQAYSPVLSQLLTEVLSLPPFLLPSLGAEFPERLCELVVSAEGVQLRTLLSHALRLFLRKGESVTAEESTVSETTDKCVMNGGGDSVLEEDVGGERQEAGQSISDPNLQSVTSPDTCAQVSCESSQLSTSDVRAHGVPSSDADDEFGAFSES